MNELDGKKTAACTPTSARSSRQVAPVQAEEKLPSQLHKRKSSKEEGSGLDVLASVVAADEAKEDEKCDEDCFGAALKRQRSEPPVVADVFDAFAEGRVLFLEDESVIHFLRLLWKRLMISNEWGRKQALREEEKRAIKTVQESAKESETREAKPVKQEPNGQAISSLFQASSSSSSKSIRYRSGSLSEYPADDEYWISSKAARDVPYDWHANFFVQLSHLMSIRGVEIRESILIEYLTFLSELEVFSDARFFFRSIQDSFSPLMKRGLSRAVKKLFTLFQGVIHHESGKDFLLEMQKHGRDLGLLMERAKFQKIIIDLVRRFGENIFVRRLRVRDFVEMKMYYTHELFLNFAPLLRLFTYRSIDEFNAEREEFTALFDFYAGNSSSELSFGPGGLDAINDLVKRSNVLITAFDYEFFAVRSFCIDWMFKNMFAMLDYAGINVMLRNLNKLPLMELAFLFVRDKSAWNIKSFLFYLFTRTQRFYEDFMMTLFVLAYVPFDKDEWLALRKETRDSGADMKHVNIAFGLAEAASDIDFTRIVRGHPLVIKLTPKITKISLLSDLYKEPLELEFMRIVLARKLGLPIWATKFANFSAEGVEWSEAVGFANEHLLHAAAICEYEGPISVVSVEAEEEKDGLF